MQSDLSGPAPTGRRANRAYRFVERLLNESGIQVNGAAPWDMQLHDPGVLVRVLAHGNLALGEAYMAREWDADRLDEFFCKLLRGGATNHVNPMAAAHVLAVSLFNRQSKSRAWDVGQHHYDLGNDFYEAMLDPRMTYTCGYWKHAGNLADAQTAKLDLICRKLDLQPGQRVLDIGCGWGSFMAYAAEHYSVHCVGVTISKAQAEWGSQHHAHLPVEFRLQDYRDIDERFDHIVSIGMFEHVGRKNHRAFMETAHRCLKQDGLFLLHTIGKNARKSTPDPWIDKYIFPNGDLPSVGQIGDAIDHLFVTEDLHNFGTDYDKTLMAWCDNFEAAWPRFADALGETFFRMWRYYLQSCAGAFRARDIQLWQWVLSPKGVDGGYERVS